MLSLEFGSESIVSSSVTRSCAGRSVSLFRGDQNTARVMVFYECGREDGLAYWGSAVSVVILSLNSIGLWAEILTLWFDVCGPTELAPWRLRHLCANFESPALHDSIQVLHIWWGEGGGDYRSWICLESFCQLLLPSWIAAFVGASDEFGCYRVSLECFGEHFDFIVEIPECARVEISASASFPFTCFSLKTLSAFEAR